MIRAKVYSNTGHIVDCKPLRFWFLMSDQDNIFRSLEKNWTDAMDATETVQSWHRNDGSKVARGEIA